MTDRNLEDIETFIAAACQHGEDAEQDHEVGDLQDMLRAAWMLMTPEQQSALLQTQACQRTLKCGFYDDYGDPDEDGEDGPSPESPC